MNRTASGLVNGLLGVLIFSGSLPATRMAVLQFDPVFLTVARAAIAGLLGFCCPAARNMDPRLESNLDPSIA